MRYPTFLQYIESLSNPSQLLSELGGLQLVMDQNQEPIYSSGNFGVVFKVEINGEYKALKCFTREQSQRDNAYRVISEELTPQDPYIIPYQYFTNEITVFEHKTHYQFPVLLMEWVEGEMLSHSITRALRNNNMEAIKILRDKFYALSRWILGQPFAHGDIKPDNIMVTKEGELTLVDYDGMYLPQMKGWGQRELGTPWYQHPLRAEMKFSKEVDHYSLVMIYATLELLERGDQRLVDFYLRENMLFLPEDILSGEDQIYNQWRDQMWNSSGCFRALESPTADIPEIQELFGREIELSHENTTQLHPYCEDQLYGLVDQNNQIVIKAQYHEIKPFSEDLAAVRIEDRWGYINREGLLVIPIMYHYAASFSHSIAAVALEGRYGYIDTESRALSRFRFDYACSIREGFGVVLWRGKYGFVNTSGKMAISARYDYALNFSEGVACVRVGEFFGYINNRGRWIVEPRFRDAGSVRDGFVTVEIDGQQERVEFARLAEGLL